MTLSEGRTNELAMTILQDQMEKEGVKLRPSEIKRDAMNLAKRLKLPPADVAAFMTLIIENASEKCITELSSIKTE